MATQDELERVAERAAEQAVRRVATGAPSVEEIERIAERAAEAAVQRSVGPAVTRAINEALSAFGIDVENKRETMLDMFFVREMRKLSTDGKKQIFTVIIGIVTTAVASGFGALFLAGKFTGKVP